MKRSYAQFQSFITVETRTCGDEGLLSGFKEWAKMVAIVFY